MREAITSSILIQEHLEMSQSNKLLLQKYSIKKALNLREIKNMSQSSYPLSRGGDIMLLRSQSEAVFTYNEKTV